MFKIDRQKFGAFVAARRRELGLTQRALAEGLCVSDKAVSKWETGMSLPDISLLMPLSEALNVTVTELLLGERAAETMPAERVEDVVRAAMDYASQAPVRAHRQRGRWLLCYALSLLVCGAGLYLLHRANILPVQLIALPILSAVFGAYFCLFVRLQLPAFYDAQRVTIFYDGPFRMNLPGVRFNNRNWPHIVRAARIWCCASLAAFPPLSWALNRLSAGEAGKFILLALYLAGLFLPLYRAGKKYE